MIDPGFFPTAAADGECHLGTGSLSVVQMAIAPLRLRFSDCAAATKRAIASRQRAGITPWLAVLPIISVPGVAMMGGMSAAVAQGAPNLDPTRTATALEHQGKTLLEKVPYLSVGALPQLALAQPSPPEVMDVAQREPLGKAVAIASSVRQPVSQALSSEPSLPALQSLPLASPPAPTAPPTEPAIAAAVATPPILLAQVITPAADGVGTVVTPSGNQFDITGGQRSSDGANLFHSFSQFGLSQGQIANFLANPATRNILTRVSGGNASVIDGILRVSGGNANLYLMNPAGIVFGSNASLNIPASFTATTATAIAVGGGWFNATGVNQYAGLTGAPNRLAFGAQPGSVVNNGNLAVNPGQSLNLVGGAVISTGTLSAPGGDLTVAAVPGSSLVRISQTGSVLSLEVPTETSPSAATAPAAIMPLTLPELLTGAGAGHVTGISVNADGTVQLTGSGLAVQAGDVVATQATAGKATLIAANNLTIAPINQVAAFQTTGDLTLRAANTVRVRDSVDQPVAVRVGGNLMLAGDRGIDILALNHLPTKPFQSGGNTTLVSDGVISTDAHFAAGGDFVARTRSGAIANVLSLYDPIISVGGDFAIGNYTGASLQVTAGGNITYGNIDINAIDVAINPLVPAFVLRAGGAITGTGNVLTTAAVGNLLVDMQAGAGITTQNITTQSGNVTLTSSNASIATGALDTSGNGQGGAIALSAPNGSITTSNINTSAIGLGFPTGGTVTLNAGSDITFATISSQGINTAAAFVGSSAGGDVSIASTRGAVRGTGQIAGVTIGTAGSGAGGINGAVTLQHGGGLNNARFSIGDASINGTAGSIATGGATLTPLNVIPDPIAVPLIPNNNTVTVPALGTGTINLTFVNQAPTLAVANPTVIVPSSTATIPLSFAQLAPSIGDVNLDNAVLVIDSVNVGSLTKGGVPVVPGVTTLAPGDTLFYTPPAGSIGSISNAFTLRANDRVSFSNPVSINIERRDLGSDLFPPLPQPPLPLSVTGECSSTDIGVYTHEDRFTREFEDYLGRRAGDRKNLIQTCKALGLITAVTGIKPAIVYTSFVPSSLESDGAAPPPGNAPPRVLMGNEKATGDRPPRSDSDQLELVIVTAEGTPIYKRLSVTRAEILKVVEAFRNTITDPITRETNAYRPLSQKLYQWLVAPYETALRDRQVDNLVFIMDAGLRAVPMAALHDGQQFVVEKYSLGLMPSLSATDIRYSDIKQAQVLAMGASEFKDDSALPGVPVELATILKNQWQGKTLLNQDFTLNNLITERKVNPFGIVHLATHTVFNPGDADHSYIQLGDTKLRLGQLRQLGWEDPPVKLLVLSSCRTALGDDRAELGFAGLAYQAGVKSALASLWAVDDIGTVALMSQFYQQLKQAPIRSEALRQAQIAMLKGQVKLEEGQLKLPGLTVPLPAELEGVSGMNLAYPYYWAAFTMIGNPW